MAYFPMFVSLENKKCVIIGGGKVAARKAETLVKFGADVTVIAPEIKFDFKGCKLIKRGFRESDIEGSFIVVAATDKRDVNEKIAQICNKKNINVNVADKGSDGSFIFGATIKNNNLVIGINSGENNPALSKNIKENISEYMNNKIIRIGTRKSKLALIQTNIVAESIKKADSSVICEIVEITTEGDKNLEKKLTEFGGKGAFTGELEKALIEGKIDIAVHSGKDLPIEEGEGLEIYAVPKRENPADVIVTMKGKRLNENSVLGTGSVRRQLQLKYKTKSIRGNVETRLLKMEKGEYDGVVLAYAGLKRLGLLNEEKYDYKIMDTDEMYPAPCQGIIAVECRKDSKFKYILDRINHEDTYICFCAERCFVTELGLGCQMPVGAYAEVKNDEVCIKGVYIGNEKKYFECKMKKEDPESISKKLKLILNKWISD